MTKAGKTTSYPKTELFNRLQWVNNCRLGLGLFFFLNYNFLLYFKIFLNSGYELSLFLGMYVFMYSLFTKYYLAAPRRFAFWEIVFLSTFLAILDLLVVTAFIFFTGAVESPYYLFYLLTLASIPLTFPYFLPAILIWGLTTAAMYVFMLYFTYSSLNRYLNGYYPGVERSPQVIQSLLMVNGIGVPVAILLISFAAFFMFLNFNFFSDYFKNKKEGKAKHVIKATGGKTRHPAPHHRS